ncbi:MAG: ketoacyl-ACP synthase III [Spirochaetales bacterium]|nr:ketoacyl-ACP synthase III [Spirochaetales bacterium]
MNAYISSLGHFVPQKRVSNDELSKTLDTNDEWIRSHTGIGNRHIASEEETTAYMGYQAAKEALNKRGLTAEDIDMILVATVTPDYHEMPSTACLIQDMLGNKSCAAVDIKAACTGFVYGLEMGKGLINNGTCSRILVIGTERLSRVLDWTNRNNCILFGDGAGAAVLEVNDDETRGVINSLLRAEGSGAGALSHPKGGTKDPFKEGDVVGKDHYLFMDGRRVYEFAVRANTVILKDLMEKNNLSVDDIDWIVPHQANRRIIEAAAKRDKIPIDKFYLNMEEFANTSGASIPLALSDMEEKGLLKRGQKILTVGFGAGLTYGGNYIIW